MASPSSGDDYYASLGNEPAQASGGAEKKKIIKIVAKKAATTSTSPEPATHVVESPVEKIENVQETVTHPVEKTPEPEVYTSRTVKLPESGTLDLGAKFSSGPAVVFHTHSALPRPLASGKMRSNAPLTKWGGQWWPRGPFRQNGTSRPFQWGGARPPQGGWQNRGPQSGGFSRPNQWDSHASKPNFRKPDAPKKSFKTSKKGTKSKLAFLEEAPVDNDTFRRQKKISTEKREGRNIEDIKQTLVDKAGQEVEIGNFISVKEFSDKIGIPIVKIMGELMKNGIIVNLNSQIDFDTCFLIGETFHITVKRAMANDSSLTDLMEWNLDAILATDDTGELTIRAPIISVMGHVDHGKTSILDAFRKSDVAIHEAGGITQKIGAYQIHRNNRDITLIDTPWHEAFALMRSRGAKLTDIIILVVAADEGLKPQTIESINLAKEAAVPVVVAMNKIDKPGANVDMVKRELADNGLVPEDWGGETICVPCSAKTGVGIDTLLDMVLLVADMKQFKSHPTRPGVGTVIESYLDPGQGVVANVLINAGILNRGDAVLCGEACGKIRTMKNAFGKNVSEANSSMPVQITGLDVVPEGGQILQVMSSLDVAREKAQEYKLAASSKSINKFEQASLGNLMNRLKSGTLQYLKVVLKADSNGSMEALKASLAKIQDKDVAVKIIHAGVGAINESDVLMAGTSSAIIVAFNVPVGPNALATLSKSKIEIISEKVIYRIIEKVESIVTGMIDVKYDQILIWEGKALKIFYTAEKMQIVGLSVTTGNVQKRAQVKIIRNERVAGTGLVENLKQVGEEVSQVEEGNECGIQYKGDVRVEVGDHLEFYMTVERK